MLVDELEALDVIAGVGNRCVGDCNSHARMIALVGEEGRHADGGVVGVVEGELGKGKVVGPVLLIVLAEDAEIELDGLVDAFRLTVRLRVKGGRQVGLDLQLAEELLPPSRGKGGAAIRDDVGGEAVRTEDVLSELRGELARVVGVLGRDEGDHLRKAIDNDEDVAEAA